MQASRLLSILILLQLRGRMSATALAGEFEVSVRTIHRDIDQLSAAGVPVYAERGRAGGFALLDGYRTQLTGFTAGEAEVLLLAGLGAAAADLGIGPELAAAQLKLAASLPQGAGSRALGVSERFHLDPVDWYRRADSLSALPTVAAAVWRERRIRVTYESWNAIVSRTLDPYGLVLKAGVWYLVAAADGQPRIYRVSNIQSFELLEEGFARPKRFDLRQFWEARSRAFEQSLLKEKAHVRLTARGLKLLRYVSDAAADAVEAKHGRTPAGWVEADIPIETVAHATGQLLRLGAEVEVLAPAALRKRLASEGAAIAALYAAKKKPRRRA